MSSALARVRKAKQQKKENEELRAAGIEVLTESEKRRRQNCRENLTVLMIIFHTGETKEIFLDEYITRYADLQRSMARYTPGRNGIFVIQNTAGDLMR